MIGELVLGHLVYQVNKSMNIDEETVKKNVKAYKKSAEAEDKWKRCQENLIRTLSVNAKRKNAMLNLLIKKFQEVYSVIQRIDFKDGRGIEELEKMGEIQERLSQCVNMPAISSGKVLTDTQLLVAFVLKGGIGGLMIQDSEMNRKLASRNLAQANAYSAQIDSVCIALDGIARHVEIVTELLQNLGAIYMKSLKQIETILEKNGICEENYSDKDLEALKVSMMITKIMYRVINTPLIDDAGKIEQESIKVIQEGQELLRTIENRK